MRTAFVRPLALGLVLSATLAACATRPAAAPQGAPGAATAPSAEEQRYIERAGRLRANILAKSTWTELGEACNPGVLRTYDDTDPEAQKALGEMVRELERVIIARGIENPIDTPLGRDLLRTVVLWEAAGPRPRWDADDNVKRFAVATGLTGQVYNPETKKCDTYVDHDSVIVIAPLALSPEAVRAKGAMKVSVYSGDSALMLARRNHYEGAGREANSPFTYTHIGPVVLWRDWAIVTVQRPVEALDGVVIKEAPSAGGATYLFRRVGGEWRLFLVSRTWA